MEFVRNFDKTQGTGTVRGEVLRIDAELIEQVFGIPPGMDPLSSVIHHVHVKDWMPIRDEVAKRYVAHQCAYVGWALVLQAVSMLLMASRRPRCVSAHLLMYLQARFGTGGQKRTTKYNIASFIAGSISRETMWVKNHLKVTHPQRYYETFVGIPLTLIFLHCGVITEEECETAFEIPETGWDFPADEPGGLLALVSLNIFIMFMFDCGISDGGDAGAHIPESRAADPAPHAVDDGVLATLRAEVQRITQEKDEMATELAHLQSQSRWQRQSLLDPSETRVKTLVLDIFDLLVHVITRKSDRQMAETMGYVVYMMELCTIWCYDECFRTRSSAADSSVKHISMKDFKRFLDRCVSTRDLLLVDTVVPTNSLNHPSNAVHPSQFVQHLPRVGQDAFVMDRLLPWLRMGPRYYWVLAAMLVQTRDTDCLGDDCPPAPEAEDPTPEVEDPTLEPEEPTRELDEPTREPAVLVEESARVPLGVPCSRRLPLFGMESAWHSWSAM
ncbi:hypothetical protein R1sor_019212 [Riccia sorocarpa]|uniref:Odorant receptor n=1 Tax=Riccia sorocarpa TaxID=122646 RepID=A0ABD3IBW5_9MARC